MLRKDWEEAQSSQQRENKTISKREPFNKVLYWRAQRKAEPQGKAVPRGRSVLTELAVQVLVLFVVRGLGEADGGVAVAFADEGLAGLVFAWKRASGEA